jgi:hypothetical protein
MKKEGEVDEVVDPVDPENDAEVVVVVDRVSSTDCRASSSPE